jgi:hypothetical protein
MAWIIVYEFPVCQGNGWAGYVEQMLSALAPAFVMLQLCTLNIPVVFCHCLLVALPWNQCEEGFYVKMCQIIDVMADHIGFFILVANN